jgi:beta-glucanase (GH16 family)
MLKAHNAGKPKPKIYVMAHPFTPRLIWLAFGLFFIACQPIAKPSLLPPGSNWQLVFHDEFEGNALDSGKWITCLNPDWCQNHDLLSIYRPDNVTVSEGTAKLTARRESVNGFDYTSGAIATSETFSFTYGYMEMRAKLPKGKGLWPAFWTLRPTRQWPPEIDVMEVLGHEPDHVHLHTHFVDPAAKDNHGNEGKYWKGPDFSAGFHTFAVNWQPGLLTWYVDGVERYRNTHAPDVPMYLIANLAVGADNSWPGAPDATTVFPASYEIDYIRVYQ